ncbi:SPOR domain-containing protein [uncultured Alsobacter sp.]|uniref:SPOR domain-containing protein n=1 Tax=uncultured Alsobacter sp. TaxID=1748258 RepID=UPI0025F86776|nr:SPOR domain-containing protein [uncultured Alsobacter sp.]
MTEQNRSRPVIDLDELERQLRAASAPRPVAPAGAPGRDDPLAELARIVGQDDPYRQAPAARPVAAPRPVPPAPYAVPAAPEPAPAPSQRFEASDFEAELAALSRGEPFVPPQGQAPAAPMAPPTGEHQAVAATDAASWALRTPARDDRFQPAPQGAADPYAVRPDPELEPVYEPEGQLPPHDAPYAEPPRRSRRGLYAVMVVMGVAVIGVSAGFAVKNTLSGSKVASGGTPPVIKADTGPMKIAPENPGGVEVPNQDRQVFNKGTPEDTKGAKVVGGEEQPVDVNQVARLQAKPAVPAPAGTGTTTAAVVPAPPASSVELPKPPQATALPPGLGEPRRVKTVSVRPDGTIIDSDAGPVGGAPRSVTVASAPVATADTSGSAVAVPPQRPTAGATPAAPTTRPAQQTSTATAAPTPKPAAPRPTQVASTQPVAATEATDTASSGGFAVQLAAPASEQEARDTASRLGRRFAGELGDLKPGIRKAEVNGKTIYRVRVGSLSREDATALCEKLKAAGGQCFIAKN